ncbi:hypothetical protein FOZ63_033509 [Perkinsus olseni]|uniref:Uncharacterized protein n=1 Tax=Perkinsus olseni TaxID=32597 RepID=A0A7J6Q8I6_PEROL|nr:hypothetical protein FOZ63_033509 [Perkinsus olseni]
MERVQAAEVVMIRELLEDDRFRGNRVGEDKVVRVIGEVLRSENVDGGRTLLLHDRGSCVWADVTEMWKPFEHVAIGSWVTVIAILRPGVARELPEDLNRQHPQLFTTQQCIDEAGMDVPELKFLPPIEKFISPSPSPGGPSHTLRSGHGGGHDRV